MSIFKDEHALVLFLKRRLKGQYQKIYTDINLASHKFYDHWKEWWGKELPPAQPQIDLLIVDRLSLFGVELKYFRKINNRINYPFYKGIEEALALLRFGFRCVSLWHFFDSALTPDVINRYFVSASNVINIIGLPINYHALVPMKDDDQILLYCVHVNGFSLIDKPPDLYGKSNPLSQSTESKKMLDFLRMILRIPTE